MILDTSATAAIFFEEPRGRCRISTVNFLELSMVLEGQIGMGYVAWQAFHDFGMGRLPAGLNLGDCCACPLARLTDILSAL